MKNFLVVLPILALFIGGSNMTRAAQVLTDEDLKAGKVPAEGDRQMSSSSLPTRLLVGSFLAGLLLLAGAPISWAAEVLLDRADAVTWDIMLPEVRAG